MATFLHKHSLLHLVPLRKTVLPSATNTLLKIIIIITTNLARESKWQLPPQTQHSLLDLVPPWKSLYRLLILKQRPKAAFPRTQNTTYLILFLCATRRLCSNLVRESKCNLPPYTQRNLPDPVPLWKTVTNIVQPFPIHTTNFILFLCGRLLPILRNPSPYTQLTSSCISVEDCYQYCATLPHTHN